MKLTARIALLLVVAGLLQFARAGSRSISASTDANGNQHPGTAAVKGPATVTCSSATESAHKPGDPPPACYVTGPGVGARVEKGHQVGTTGAGTVTLICNGNGRLTCSAQVVD